MNWVITTTTTTRFEFWIMNQIGTSVSFDIKNGTPPPRNAGTLFEDDCVSNGSTGKVAAWGGGGEVLIYL